MKINCGTDIIEIYRIRESIEKLGDTFLNKIFTENEIKYCESKKKQKYQHYAARFAVKEAAFKALSWKLNSEHSVPWKDLEVENDKTGKPILKINCCDLSEIENVDISISHCKEYAIACVTVLSR